MERFCMGCMEPYDDQLEVCPHCGYIHGTDALEPCHIAPGSVLAGRYIVGRVLGFGGFGVTYIGYDQTLSKKVAVKEYFPGEFSTRMPNQTRLTVFSGDKQEQFLAGKAKFIDEARRLAKFQNVPEIVGVYDCFEDNNTAYIVMEYLDGISLKEKLEQEKTMTVEQALPIILDVLHGLEAVHKEGILHRDIAPDNIHITKSGQVKLLDFGAARFATTTHSRSLTVLIKPGFAPEEQYRSRGDQGTWTDVYAVAATFYKMLTGITPEDALERAAKDRLKAPSRLGVTIGPNTETALMNALNVKVEGRTQTAKQFEEELMANVVKRVIVKKQKVDIGAWPLWIKAASAAAVAGVGIFAVLVAAGVIQFQIQGWSGNTVPDGKTRVPNVINEEMETAVARGEEAQLTVQVYDKQYSDEIPENKVLSQTIKGGSVVDLNETLGIVISAGIEKTNVPNVIGMESEEAIRILKEAGLVVTSREEQYRAAPGTIGWQSLDAASQADTGSGIEVIISKGIEGGDSKKTETVESIAGSSYEEAAAELLSQYLYLIKAETQYSDDVPAGVIISQDPEAGTRLNQNSNIKVVVSLGRENVYVPDVQYKTEEEARKLLEGNSLTADIRYEANASVAEGNVIRQDPASGGSVEKGSAVVIYVSRDQEGNDTAAGQDSGRPAPEQTRFAPVNQPETQPSQTQPEIQPETQPPQPQPIQSEAPAEAPSQTQPEAPADEIWDIIGD